MLVICKLNMSVHFVSFLLNKDNIPKDEKKKKKESGFMEDPEVERFLVFFPYKKRRIELLRRRSGEGGTQMKRQK